MIIYNAHKNFHGRIRMSIALGLGVCVGGRGEGGEGGRAHIFTNTEPL